MSGDQSVERFAPLADHLVAVEPDADLVTELGRRPAAAQPVAQDRPGADLLGPVPERGDRARPRPVPLVRRRLEGQRRPADDRRRSTPRASSSGRRTSPSRSRAGRTSTRTSRPSPRTGRPASPTSPSSRSATTASSAFLDDGGRDLCSRPCGAAAPTERTIDMAVTSFRRPAPGRPRPRVGRRRRREARARVGRRRRTSRTRSTATRTSGTTPTPRRTSPATSCSSPT